jgi:hypothetical protein
MMNGIGLDLTGRIVGRTAAGGLLVELTVAEYLETLPVIGQRSQDAVDVDFGRRAMEAAAGGPVDPPAGKPVRKAGRPRKAAQEPARRGRGKPKQLPAQKAC